MTNLVKYKPYSFMKNLVLIAFVISNIIYGQQKIDDVIKKMNKNTVPYISINDLKKENNVVLLDAREPKEFNISHLKNAVCVGYNKFDKKSVLNLIPDKQAKIVVYCSIGVRSEQIGEKLIKLGYTNVQNLYGGIFEWKNQGNTVIDNENNTTEKVHAFDKIWGVYLKKGEKVY